MECDGKLPSSITLFHFISIHALTWSATKRSDSDYRIFDISIHALTWSATQEGQESDPPTDDFNPRTHMECDNCLPYIAVSCRDFNPRTHMECDH